MDEMEIVQDRGATGTTRILRLNGPLTLSTLFGLQAALRELGNADTVIDLAAVPYMDSAGLGCVISILASCQRTKRGFAVIGLTERIRTLFEVTGVNGLIPCFDTLDAAEAAVMHPAV